MNKKELIEKIAKENNITQRSAGNILNSALENISATLYTGEGVNITGFGSFGIKQRAGKTIANPRKQGELMTVAEHTAIVFKPAAKLKEYVNYDGTIL